MASIEKTTDGLGLELEFCNELWNW